MRYSSRTAKSRRSTRNRRLARRQPPPPRLLLRREAGTNDIVLAEEAEFVNRFRGCQLGTAPPFGNLFGLETFADRELARQEHIVFNAGTHRDAILMSFADYRRLAHPHLVRVAVKSDERQPQFIQV